MNLTTDYTAALWGLLVVIATVIAQWFIASGAKAKQPGAVPGKIDESLSHESFVFRSHRTFMNSLENVPTFLGTAFLALFAGASAQWAALFVWLFAVCRIAHMALYYGISTEQNPSPRTWFFLIGGVANIALLVLAGIALV